MKNRRDFLKTLSMGAAIMSVGRGRDRISDAAQKSQNTVLQNGLDLELLTAGNRFLGIGRVAADDKVLRSRRLPMFVQINSPDAVEIADFRVKNQRNLETGLILDFTVRKKEGGLMEWMLHTVRNRRNLRGWNEEPEESPGTEFRMEIKPVERKIGDETVKGFSYQYFYSSPEIPIYKITDRSSWEIGGSSIGNEFWMRNGVVDSIVQFQKKTDFYSTEWHLPGIANPNIFEFHPLQTQLQGFTFTASDIGTVITWPARVAHVRSLFEKWRGQDEILHFHEHCGDLSHAFETPPVEVLWVPGRRDRVERANLYHRMRELVHETLHAQIGMKRERITTYGVIEEWQEPDFERYTRLGLRKLMDAGVKTVFIPNECQNVMNTWGLSNMCCNVDYQISETVGEDKLKKFCQAAKAGGARIEMWGNTALSATTELFSHREGQGKGIQFLPYRGSIMEVIDKARSPWVRNPSNAIEADHYTPRFCALNLRDPDVRAYWMKQWKYFHDAIGIGGIFLDSSFNMSSDKFHFRQWPEDGAWNGAKPDQKDPPGKYRPEKEPPKMIQTQYHAHLEWVVEMQKMGYQYCAEDMGVFGINRTGPGLLDRISSLPIWADSFCDFDEKQVRNAGYEPIDIFFKGLAYRMMWKLYWNIDKDRLELGTEDPRAYRLLKAFNEVEEVMIDRNILPDEKGVTYCSGSRSVLWAFSDFIHALPGMAEVKDLNSGEKQRKDRVAVFKNHVYLIAWDT